MRILFSVIIEQLLFLFFTFGVIIIVYIKYVSSNSYYYKLFSFKDFDKEEFVDNEWVNNRYYNFKTLIQINYK
mgnify:CR=1 FL=1